MDTIIDILKRICWIVIIPLLMIGTVVKNLFYLISEAAKLMGKNLTTEDDREDPYVGLG